MIPSASQQLPTRTTGSVVAVCISAIKTGDVVKCVISHTPPTFWNHVPILATNEANQMARKAAMRSGAHADDPACWLVVIAFLRG